VAEVSSKLYSYRENTGVPSFDDSKALFVFDGVCVLCSRGSNWLMRYDKAGKFNFASMQSTLGQELYRHYGVVPDDSYLLIVNGRAFTESLGYIEIGTILGGFCNVFRLFFAVPETWRDWLYRVVARNRYKWFGKTEYCAMLTSDQRARLLAQ
jgi:predicted DCC family thiol-disulfide oxidoreductase YuxK